MNVYESSDESSDNDWTDGLSDWMVAGIGAREPTVDNDYNVTWSANVTYAIDIANAYHLVSPGFETPAEYESDSSHSSLPSLLQLTDSTSEYTGSDSDHTDSSPRMGDRIGLCGRGAGRRSHGCVTELTTSQELMCGLCEGCQRGECLCHECEYGPGCMSLFTPGTDVMV